MMITQHHEPFDFATFYETVRSRYVGIDCRDFETFMQKDGEKHSFIGKADGTDRIRDALANAVSPYREIVGKATSLMITVVRSPEAEHPIMMEEIKGMTEFISSLPSGCQVVWGLADDTSLGDEVKLIMLLNTGE